MRIWGHPIHPMLVHFPIVFWTVAAGAYAADLAATVESAAGIAKWSNGAGLIMAMLAMLAGLVELRTIDKSSATMQVATRHMMVMATAWFCFLLALLLPLSAAPAMSPETAKLTAAASAGAGFLLMAIGGWLGGRLVYTFGVAVEGRTQP